VSHDSGSGGGSRTALSRRELALGLALIPFSGGFVGACGGGKRNDPETPLAHLYGKEWVRGAYGLYAGKFSGVQTAAETQSFEAYKVLAQRGIISLDALQQRDVPFTMRVSDDEQTFAIARSVPDRLTFTANMTDKDREAATLAWKKARENIHHDYDEIQRLNGSLQTLFAQLQTVRSYIDEGVREQWRLCAQLEALKGDPNALPFQLPFQVTPKDYEQILLILLARLEEDQNKLAKLEAHILTVGLVARATDAGSGSLSLNLRKVLLSVVEDGKSPPQTLVFPEADAERGKMIANGTAIRDRIIVLPEYVRWTKDEKEKKFAAVGQFLQILDMATGLKTSVVYRVAINVWKGEKDYLEYAKVLLELIPHGGPVVKVLQQGLEYTQEARKYAGIAMDVYAKYNQIKEGKLPTQEELIARVKQEALTRGQKELAKGESFVFNSASKFAMDRLPKQLSFFKDGGEMKKVTALFNQTDLITQQIPGLPPLKDTIQADLQDSARSLVQ
jgi:hypothetical protein